MNSKQLKQKIDHALEKNQTEEEYMTSYIAERGIEFTRLGDLYMIQTDDYAEEQMKLGIFDQYGNVYWLSAAIDKSAIDYLERHLPYWIQNTDLTEIDHEDASYIDDGKTKEQHDIKSDELPF